MRLAHGLAFASLLVGAQALGQEREEAPPACARISHAARFDGSGYSHLVTLENTCDQPLTCSVTTSANPTPTPLRARPGERVTVNTFLSSPASAFTPTLRCQPLAAR